MCARIIYLSVLCICVGVCMCVCVCVCVFVCVCVCVCVCTCVCLYIHIYVNAHKCMYAHVYTRIHVHTHADMHKNTTSFQFSGLCCCAPACEGELAESLFSASMLLSVCVCEWGMYVNMYNSLCRCIHVQKYVCMYMYIYIYVLM